MKNLLGLLFVIILLSSCGKNDSEKLVGVWNITGIESEVETVVSTPGNDDITSNVELMGADFDATIEFKSDPNEYIALGNYTIHTVTTTIAGTMTNSEDVLADITGTWTIDGNTLTTISSMGDTSITDLTTFTNSKIVAEADIFEMETQFQITTTSNGFSRVTYTK